jgi:hypothetical protein
LWFVNGVCVVFQRESLAGGWFSKGKRMKKFGIVATLAGMAMLAPVASSAAVVTMFDDFNTDQLVVDAPYSGSANTSTVGNRTLSVATTVSSGSSSAQSILEATGGSLQISGAKKAQSRATVTYTGVGDIDLGSNGYFLFSVGAFDGTLLPMSSALANFSAVVTDTFGNSSTYSELLDLSFSPFLYFSQFTGSADFNTVASVVFTINTTGLAANVDGELTAIQVGAVPVPAAGFLMIGALGGLVSLRRKKSA